MFKNKKGQAFEAYQLLIAFIVSLAILGIILTMVNQTNQKALIISNQKIEDAFISAINSPIISMEKPFVVKDVLVSGFISSSRFEQLGGIEPGCFGFITGPGIQKTERFIEIESRYLKTDVYFVCGLSEMNPINNNVYFEITTGSDPPVPNWDLCERLFCVMYVNKMPSTN